MSAHAFLSCSGAYRWMTCPGSPRLEAQFPRQESVYAAEGTTAHSLLETALLLGESDIAAAVPLVEGSNIEMADTLQPVMAWVADLLAERPNATLFIERRVNPGATLGREDLWGTCDLLIFDPDGSELIVGDLKYGAGHAVEAVGNVQLRLYALGALAIFQPMTDRPIERVTTAILQPRAIHAAGPVRTETLSVADLDTFAAGVRAAAVATEDPEALLVAGDHCTFCRAAGGCPELSAVALTAARDAFRSVDQPLEPSRIAILLAQADTIRSWLKALESHALFLARAGTEIPGFKLQGRRGHRAWADAESALAILTETYGLDPDLIAPRKLATPRQVEMAVKRATGSKADLSPLVRVPDLGPRLVPDSAPGEDDPFTQALAWFAGLEDEAANDA